MAGPPRAGGLSDMAEFDFYMGHWRWGRAVDCHPVAPADMRNCVSCPEPTVGIGGGGHGANEIE